MNHDHERILLSAPCCSPKDRPRRPSPPLPSFSFSFSPFHFPSQSASVKALQAEIERLLTRAPHLALALEKSDVAPGLNDSVETS